MLAVSSATGRASGLAARPCGRGAALPRCRSTARCHRLRVLEHRRPQAIDSRRKRLTLIRPPPCYGSGADGSTAWPLDCGTKRVFAGGEYGEKLRRSAYWAAFVLYGAW